MCGIAGYIGYKEIPNERILACLNLMRRRGPDHQDFKHFFANDKHVYLLHSRLSIIDLDPRSHQPFTIGDCTIVFNGEIYNYIELRDELEKKGVIFKTDSDTEVLLQSYLMWGEKCLDKFEGMWAFAVFNSKENSIFLSRDRFGEKPLYYFKDDNGFYFASEIKFIFSLLNKKTLPNKNLLLKNILYGYRTRHTSEETFFRDVFSFPKACYMKTDLNISLFFDRYWNITNISENDDMSFEEACKGVRNLLINSVKLRLRSDVPLAFCMSGGIDSNSLISIAKKLFNYDVHGYTIWNDDARYDESKLVLSSVNYLGINHIKVNLKHDNFIQILKTMVSQHDGPVATISYYLHWLLEKSISNDGFKVSVSGSGGDEFFSGYYDHHLAYLADMNRYADVASYESALQSWKDHVLPRVRNPFLKDHSLFIKNPEFSDHLYDHYEELSYYFKVKIPKKDKQKYLAKNILRNRMLNEVFYECIPVYLHEDDHNSMYFSVENRSPILDRALFEFSLKIPTSYFIRNGYAKAILRNAMQGIVCDEILWERQKIGFNAPIEDLININRDDFFRWISGDSPIYEMINKNKVMELFNNNSFPNHQSKFIFNFICTKIFLEE